MCISYIRLMIVIFVWQKQRNDARRPSHLRMMWGERGLAQIYAATGADIANKDVTALCGRVNGLPMPMQNLLKRPIQRHQAKV